MVVAGVAGVAISLLGYERALAESVLGNPLPDWFLARPGRAWLVIQAVLVIVGGVGEFRPRWRGEGHPPPGPWR